MVERRTTAGILAHVILILGVLVVAFPVYVTFVASTHTALEMVQRPIPMLPGSHFIDNYLTVLR
ncbi:MAG: glycerol-3-phosphate transporter, partial [Rhodoferax sp.]